MCGGAAADWTAPAKGPEGRGRAFRVQRRRKRTVFVVQLLPVQPVGSVLLQWRRGVVTLGLFGESRWVVGVLDWLRSIWAALHTLCIKGDPNCGVSHV